MIQEITTFIAQKSVLWGFTQSWTLGTNLFAGHVPVKNALGVDTPIRYLAVLENAGGARLENVGGIGAVIPPAALACWPKYVEKAVQLLNRAEDYITAHDDAEELYEALDNTAGWNLPLVAPANRQYLVCVIDAYGLPAPVGNPDDKGLFQFSTNYIWKIEEGWC